MAILSEMRANLAQLLMREISLNDFEDWFVPYSRNIHKQADKDAQEFAYDIQHVLAEYDEDSIALRHALMKVVLSSANEEPLSSNSVGDSSVAESYAEYETAIAS